MQTMNLTPLPLPLDQTFSLELTIMIIPITPYKLEIYTIESIFQQVKILLHNLDIHFTIHNR